jgi:hypothetical protein
MSDAAIKPGIAIVPANEASWDHLEAVLERTAHSGLLVPRFKG